MNMHVIFDLLDLILLLFNYALIIYILMSWIPGSRDTAFGYFLRGICEPYLEPFRKIIPPIGGMIDITPIIAIFVLHFARVYGLTALASMLLGMVIGW